MSKKQRTEVFFLKISRFIIVVMMGLALLMTIVMGGFAAYQYSQSPQEPAAIKKPETPKIDESEFVNEYFKITPTNKESASEKSQVEKPDTQSKKSAPEKPKQPDYSASVQQLVSCTMKAAGSNPKFGKDQIEGIADQMVNIANANKSLGAAYMNDSARFVCSVMSSQQTAENYKDGTEDLIDYFVDVASYHLDKWNEQVAVNAELEELEKIRIAEEMEEELERVEQAQADAWVVGQAALGSLATFMLLALYLIFSAIESNLRNINQTLNKLASKDD